MKILHIISWMAIGGAQRLLADLLPIINHEVDVTLLVSKRVDNAFIQTIENAGVKIISIEYDKIHSPLNIIKVARYLKNYDVIHVHLFPSLYWVALANIFYGKPLVYTEHSTYNQRRTKWYWRGLEKWIYGRYEKIISISALTQRNLMTWLQAKHNDKRFVVINNGINVKLFSTNEASHEYSKTLIMIGRFSPAKDQATIIKAMALLKDDIHLILVGNGRGIEECKSLACQLKVDNRVHFVGTQSDVSAWIAKADVGIQSSKWEGFGLAAVEMMAGGLPVVATDVDGLREVVQGAGILFPVGNYQILADIINHLLADKRYYDDIKAKCLERSMQYDIHVMADAYMNVYKKLSR